jgi:hypothetical protein
MRGGSADVVDAAVSELLVARRFSGPPGAANGGFACGALAAMLGGGAGAGVEVTLRQPVPLERPLAVRRNGGALLVEDDGRLLAEARPSASEVELAVADAPTPLQARAAAGRAAYYDDPVFPGCFVCGPARAPGDGLRIFPGPVTGRSLWAAPWTPDPSVAGPTARSATRWCGRRWTVPAGWPRRTPATWAPAPRRCSAR